jgi:hypothetical protein
MQVLAAKLREALDTVRTTIMPGGSVRAAGDLLPG